MIAGEDIRRLARESDLPAGVIEKDYAITWLLYGLYDKGSPLREGMIFKGGTAILKAYFPKTWRLSEDMDFTVVDGQSADSIRSGYEAAFGLLAESSGMVYNMSDFASGFWTVLLNVHYTGPLASKNRISQDITRQEKLVDKPVFKEVAHPYPDIEPFRVKVYSLTEILLEKIRSIFQRGKARDYYDVWRLLRENEPEGDLRELLIKKCEINNIPYSPELIFEESRLSEAKSYWEPALGYQTKDLPEFGTVIDDLREMLSFLKD